MFVQGYLNLSNMYSNYRTKRINYRVFVTSAWFLGLWFVKTIMLVKNQGKVSYDKNLYVICVELTKFIVCDKQTYILNIVSTL